MQHLDEGTIHAWIDGELSPEQASELETHVKDCATCAAMVAEARGLVAASTRILTALDHVPGGVLPSEPDIAPAQVTRRRWYQRTDVRAAAALLFVAGASLVVVQSGTDQRGTRAMIATPDKAPAASSSSAATEPAGTEAMGRVQQGVADAANASPILTAPAEADKSASREMLPEKTSATTVSPKTGSELRFGAVVGARAAEVADLPPPPAARLDAAAPAAVVTEGAVSNIVVAAPLRVIRADSTSGTKRTVYEVSRGIEVTLTESPAAADNRENAAKDLERQKGAAPQSSGAAREAPQVLSARTGGAKPAPPAAPMPPPFNTISWTDRGKRYTLSGWLAVKDLEAIKARLMQARR